jgi:hypothetical protein
LSSMDMNRMSPLPCKRATFYRNFYRFRLASSEKPTLERRRLVLEDDACEVQVAARGRHARVPGGGHGCHGARAASHHMRQRGVAGVVQGASVPLDAGQVVQIPAAEAKALAEQGVVER